LIGDNCIDTYLYGVVNRISPEAPVPIFEPRSTFTKEGMAGNVKNNLLNLGCVVDYRHGETSEKQRLIDQRSKQQLVRIDKDKISQPITVDLIGTDYDAIVISDYNKGTISYESVSCLRKKFDGPIFIDTKKTDLKQFDGCFVKVNSDERAKSVTLPDPKWLIVTRGSKGAEYMEETYSTKSVDVADVTGAGDTFISALVYNYLSTGGNICQSIIFANIAAGITVQHQGVYAPTLKEITVCGTKD